MSGTPGQDAAYLRKRDIEDSYARDQAARRTLADLGATVTRNGETLDLKGAPMVTTAEKPRTRKLVGGGDPDAPFNPPAEDTFVDKDKQEVEFLEADSLKNLAQLLIERKTVLGPCRRHKIRYAWRKSGGQLNKAPKFGKAERLGKLDRWLAADGKDKVKYEWVVWLAADHLAGATAFQIEAELFNAMCSIGENEKGTPAVNPPDFIGYHPAIQEYGTWREEIRVLSEQLRFGELE